MSKLAGILMVILGILTMLVGGKELFKHPSQLTAYAAWTSIGLGLLIGLAGMGHFRAPHKAFLISVPILITFVLHVYCLALFFDVKNLPLFVGGHALAVVVILLLSYFGYRSKVPADV